MAAREKRTGMKTATVTDVLGVTLGFFLAAILSTVIGWIIGFCVGLIFPDVMWALRQILGVTLSNAQLGALLGFVGGFFRSK